MARDTIQLLEVNDAAALAADWRALAANAAEPNAFYEPGFALAALHHLLPDAKLLAVRRGGVLVAIWPVAWKQRRFGIPLPLMAVEQAYAPLTTPLLHKDHAGDAARALLNWVREQGASALFVPKISETGAAAAALADAMTALGMAQVRINPHQRAALDHTHGTEISAKATKDFRRLRRRLEETGALTLTIARNPDEATAALEEFLTLEQRGWKGRAGNPLGGNSADAAFIRAAVADMAEQGGVRIALLRRDGVPIAGALVFTSAGRAFYFKTAYDEASAKFSPGVLLTQDLTAHLLADESITLTDSVADAGHPMIDRLWTGRIAISDWMIAPRGDGALFRFIVLLENLRQAARGYARRAKMALRR